MLARPRPRLSLLLSIALLACLEPGGDRSLDASGRARAQPPGAVLQHLELDEALARAARAGQRVLLYFGASWCPPCHALHREILDRPEGARLLAGMVLVERDFDAPASRALVERFAIIQLPTTIVLVPGGEHGIEVARLVGYEQRERWVAEMRAARTAVDPMPALRAAVAARPDDAVAWLALGRSGLARQDPAAAEADLERAVWLGGASSERTARDAAAEALFVLGRYYQRVRRDSRTARHVWRELATRFPDSASAAGAWYWHADAQRNLGRPELGLLAYRQRADARPADLDAQTELAEHALGILGCPERAIVRDRLRALLAGAPRDRLAALDALLGRLDEAIASERSNPR